MDIELSIGNVVEPDLFVLLKGNPARFGRHIMGSPDLAIEILSPGSFARDTVEKFALCARHGVQEYWILDPANQVIEIFRLEQGAYQLHSHAAVQGEVNSALLPGLVVQCEEVFAA